MYQDPLVSVIIPTRNSQNTILTCIESIQKQTYENLEIIIIDGGSTDATTKIAKEKNAIVYVFEYERTKAKNYALKIAKGEYVIFIDSDMELTKKIIKNCVDIAEKEKNVGGIIIPEITVGKGYWIKVRAFERSISLFSELESPRFFNRKIALEVGGFDEKVIFYEESTLPQKIERKGYNTKFRIADNILHHENNFNFKHWLKKKQYYGKSIEKYLPEYRKYGKNQISIKYRIRIYIRNGRWELLKKIHLTVGMIILKSAELIAVKTNR